LTESSDILLLKVTSPQALPAALTQALASLQGIRDDSGWIRLQDGEAWESVLRLAWDAKLPPEAMVTVYCEIRPDSGSQEYRRLWDRTEDLAHAVALWSEGKASWPRLQPGELVRLTSARSRDGRGRAIDELTAPPTCSQMQPASSNDPAAAVSSEIVQVPGGPP
jgi:hypothetical protein